MSADLRLSDAEREQASQALAEHYAAGRITTEEHHERLESVWEARTRGDLRPVFADLPGGAPVKPESLLPFVRLAAEQRTAREERRRRRPPWPVRMMVLVGLAFLLFTHLPWFFLAVGVWWLLASTGRMGATRGGARRGCHGGLSHRT